MTREEFENAEFYNGIKAKGYDWLTRTETNLPIEGDVISVNFDQGLIGICQGEYEGPDDIWWFRFEYVELLSEKKFGL